MRTRYPFYAAERDQWTKTWLGWVQMEAGGAITYSGAGRRRTKAEALADIKAQHPAR